MGYSIYFFIIKINKIVFAHLIAV